MTARDDLAADLAAAYRRRGTVNPGFERYVADLVAAGWSRPRVVTTAAELDELPDGTVIVHREDFASTYYPFQKVYDVPQVWCGLGSSQGAHSNFIAFEYGSFEVVWSPPAETQGAER